ncbi:uncharacterized protein LOC117186171 isoform X2 [Drosophila miranda]|uniref:uncharacterized protein LOC117186171 isoform X2 n=1 Tax=Drosophila miranda TaxID=7229 RepID=UPI00143F74C0|nr:uncharacterized protein LOC117186171 isoform X2 [Drosophila miranda]
MQKMDLLCSESLVCDSDLSLYRINKQTLAAPKIKTDLASICPSITSTGAGNDEIAVSSLPNVSPNSVVCKRSEIVYIYAADSLITQNQSLQLQEQGIKERFTRSCSEEPAALRPQEWQIKSDSLGTDHVNTAIGDPTFKSDRCLENVLKTEEKHQHIVETYFITVQRDITPAMRKIVAEWMMEKWELYVLSRLGWDLSSVTPLDFLDLLIRRVPINSTKIPDISFAKVRQHAQAFISMAAKEHQFAKYPASTIAASSIAASMSGLKWHLRTGHNLPFLLGLLTDLTSIEQVQLQECMLHMENIFEEHSRNLQPFFVDIQPPNSAKMYCQRRNQTHPNQQYHQQRPQRMRQMPIPSLTFTTADTNADQNCFKATLPYRTQTFKILGQAKNELQDIKF